VAEVMQVVMMQTAAAMPTPVASVQPAASAAMQQAAPVAVAPAAAAAPADASTPVPATPVMDAAAAARVSAEAAPAATTATHATKPVAGVTFPVRPATGTAMQAPAPAVGHASAADAGSIGGALFSLVLVVGLIFALGWLAKRMPGFQRGAGASSLRVVASVSLGPRDRAVVVDVGGTQLLLGVSQGGVRTLHTLDAPLPVAEAPSAPSPFAQILAQHFGKKP
jgi:flagellar protein FliO/FliZ